MKKEKTFFWKIGRHLFINTRLWGILSYPVGLVFRFARNVSHETTSWDRLNTNLKSGITGFHGLLVISNPAHRTGGFAGLSGRRGTRTRTPQICQFCRLVVTYCTQQADFLASSPTSLFCETSFMYHVDTLDTLHLIFVVITFIIAIKGIYCRQSRKFRFCFALFSFKKNRERLGERAVVAGATT